MKPSKPSTDPSKPLFEKTSPIGNAKAALTNFFARRSDLDVIPDGDEEFIDPVPLVRVNQIRGHFYYGNDPILNPTLNQPKK